MVAGRFLTRFDERFEPTPLYGIVLTDSVLTDIESQEGETDFAFFTVKRVRDTGFLLAEFQSHRL